MRRSVWSTLVLGLWLMLSPFVLAFINRRALAVLWEDLLLGFGIATFSLCRILSRRKGEIVFADWLVLALGFLTLINPFLYSYANTPLAKWNNIIFGGIIFALAVYQDWQDERRKSRNQRSEGSRTSAEA
ncbi:MAG TPA: SPW repeat protein [Candidatus Eisenbacteria bacterium]|nr:SPW repeat protein [Candidatus Eisenbacteria bacterium]